jgi:hypothetical protein
LWKGKDVERFEYEVTMHRSDNFKEEAFACSEAGECKIPSEQNALLTRLLNERGLQGWELVQLFINKTGATAFWKRKLKNKEK